MRLRGSQGLCLFGALNQLDLPAKVGPRERGEDARDAPCVGRVKAQLVLESAHAHAHSCQPVAPRPLRTADSD
jgi:hypothetical protein